MYNESIPVAATEDLSSAQYHAVQIGGTLANNSNACVGILQDKPASGEHGGAVYVGRSRFRAGAAVAAQAALSVSTSGWFVTTTSGQPSSGKSLSAVASGAIGEGIFNFAQSLTI